LNKAFRERLVRKVYRLRCRRRPQVTEGVVTHYYKKPVGNEYPGVLYSSNPSSPSPSKHSITPAPNKAAVFKKVELKILSAVPSREATNEETGEPLWLVEVELLTGLTHQIRLQFAAMNAAINGDLRYIPVEGLDGADVDGYGGLDDGAAPKPRPELGGATYSGIDLQCASLTFPAGCPGLGKGNGNGNEEIRFEAPRPAWFI
jgi:23S rRNA-/tRNA-specific pseudouridylate synthase